VVKKWPKIALFWPFLTIFEIPTPIFPKKLDFFGFFGKNPKISVKLALNYPIKTIITQKHQNYHLWVPKWHFWDLRRAKFQYGVTVGHVGSPYLNNFYNGQMGSGQMGGQLMGGQLMGGQLMGGQMMGGQMNNQMMGNPMMMNMQQQYAMQQQYMMQQQFMMQQQQNQGKNQQGNRGRGNSRGRGGRGGRGRGNSKSKPTAKKNDTPAAKTE